MLKKVIKFECIMFDVYFCGVFWWYGYLLFVMCFYEVDLGV